MTGAVHLRRLVLLACVALAGIGTFGAARAAAAFEEGVVNVTGYNWSPSLPTVDVNLASIGPTGGGQNRYTVKQILQAAQPHSDSQFDLATIPGISVARPNGATVKCTGNQVRAENDACPVFSTDSNGTYMSVGSGTPVQFTQANPVIRIDRYQDMTVTVNPARRTIRSGQSVTFQADVTNPVGTLTYKWSFGDGKTTTTSKPTVSHVYRGDDEEFSLILTVTSSANSRTYYGSALITVGKVTKERKPKKKEKQPQANNGGGGGGTPSYGGYVPGYYDDWGDYGGGGGSSAGSPSPPDPQPPEEEPEVPVDDGLETVSGQLITPDLIATIPEPTDGAATGTEEAAPADDTSEGGGISDGALTAIGIGALLGLGGLTEAGAFAGFRRFRFRP